MPGDEVGRGEIADEAAVQLLIEVEVEVVECFLRIAKLGGFSPSFQQTITTAMEFIGYQARNQIKSVPCARSELDEDEFPIQRRYRRDAAVLRHVEVQSDSYFGS